MVLVYRGKLPQLRIRTRKQLSMKISILFHKSIICVQDQKVCRIQTNSTQHHEGSGSLWSKTFTVLNI